MRPCPELQEQNYADDYDGNDHAAEKYVAVHGVSFLQVLHLATNGNDD